MADARVLVRVLCVALRLIQHRLVESTRFHRTICRNEAHMACEAAPTLSVATARNGNLKVVIATAKGLPPGTAYATVSADSCEPTARTEPVATSEGIAVWNMTLYFKIVDPKVTVLQLAVYDDTGTLRGKHLLALSDLKLDMHRWPVELQLPGQDGGVLLAVSASYVTPLGEQKLPSTFSPFRFESVATHPARAGADDAALPTGREQVRYRDPDTGALYVTVPFPSVDQLTDAATHKPLADLATPPRPDESAQGLRHIESPVLQTRFCIAHVPSHCHCVTLLVPVTAIDAAGNLRADDLERLATQGVPPPDRSWGFMDVFVVLRVVDTVENTVSAYVTPVTIGVDGGVLKAMLLARDAFQFQPAAFRRPAPRTAAPGSVVAYPATELVNSLLDLGPGVGVPSERPANVVRTPLDAFYTVAVNEAAPRIGGKPNDDDRRPTSARTYRLRPLDARLLDLAADSVAATPSDSPVRGDSLVRLRPAPLWFGVAFDGFAAQRGDDDVLATPEACAWQDVILRALFELVAPTAVHEKDAVACPPVDVQVVVTVVQGSAPSIRYEWTTLSVLSSELCGVFDLDPLLAIPVPRLVDDTFPRLLRALLQSRLDPSPPQLDPATAASGSARVTAQAVVVEELAAEPVKEHVNALGLRFDDIYLQESHALAGSKIAGMQSVLFESLLPVAERFTLDTSGDRAAAHVALHSPRLVLRVAAVDQNDVQYAAVTGVLAVQCGGLELTFEATISKVGGVAMVSAIAHNTTLPLAGGEAVLAVLSFTVPLASLASADFRVTVAARLAAASVPSSQLQGTLAFDGISLHGCVTADCIEHFNAAISSRVESQDGNVRMAAPADAMAAGWLAALAAAAGTAPAASPPGALLQPIVWAKIAIASDVTVKRSATERITLRVTLSGGLALAGLGGVESDADLTVAVTGVVDSRYGIATLQSDRRSPSAASIAGVPVELVRITILCQGQSVLEHERSLGITLYTRLFTDERYCVHGGGNGSLIAECQAMDVFGDLIPTLLTAFEPVTGDSIDGPLPQLPGLSLVLSSLSRPRLMPDARLAVLNVLVAGCKFVTKHNGSPDAHLCYDLLLVLVELLGDLQRLVAHRLHVFPNRAHAVTAARDELTVDFATRAMAGRLALDDSFFFGTVTIMGHLHAIFVAPRDGGNRAVAMVAFGRVDGGARGTCNAGMSTVRAALSLPDVAGISLLVFATPTTDDLAARLLAEWISPATVVLIAGNEADYGRRVTSPLRVMTDRRAKVSTIANEHPADGEPPQCAQHLVRALGLHMVSANCPRLRPPKALVVRFTAHQAQPQSEPFSVVLWGSVTIPPRTDAAEHLRALPGASSRATAVVVGLGCEIPLDLIGLSQPQLAYVGGDPCAAGQRSSLWSQLESKMQPASPCLQRDAATCHALASEDRAQTAAQLEAELVRVSGELPPAEAADRAAGETLAHQLGDLQNKLVEAWRAVPPDAAHVPRSSPAAYFSASPIEPIEREAQGAVHIVERHVAALEQALKDQEPYQDAAAQYLWQARSRGVSVAGAQAGYDAVAKSVAALQREVHAASSLFDSDDAECAKTLQQNLFACIAKLRDVGPAFAAMRAAVNQPAPLPVKEPTVHKDTDSRNDPSKRPSSDDALSMDFTNAMRDTGAAVTAFARAIANFGRTVPAIEHAQRAALPSFRSFLDSLTKAAAARVDAVQRDALKHAANPRRNARSLLERVEYEFAEPSNIFARQQPAHTAEAPVAEVHWYSQTGAHLRLQTDPPQAPASRSFQRVRSRFSEATV